MNVSVISLPPLFQRDEEWEEVAFCCVLFLSVKIDQREPELHLNRMFGCTVYTDTSKVSIFLFLDSLASLQEQG